MEGSEIGGEKNSLQPFPPWVLWQPGHLASQGSHWAPYVHHETLGRIVHVSPSLLTTHTHTLKQIHRRQTQTHRNTCMPHAGCQSFIKHAYKHDFMWLNTHASTAASTDGWGIERDGGSLMSYEGSRGQRESSVLAAVRPLKCHPDKAGNQLEHGASTTRTHTCTNTTAALWEDTDCNHRSIA